MDHGWIKIHRSVLEWEWFDDANTFRVFFYCLIKANHRLKKWHGIDIPRGTLVMSYRGIAKKLKISLQQARTSIDKLVLTQEVTRRSTHRYTLVTICNYETYQLKKKSEQHSSNTVNNTVNNTVSNTVKIDDKPKKVTQSVTQSVTHKVTPTKKVLRSKEKNYTTTIQEIVANFYSTKQLNYKLAIKPTNKIVLDSCDVIDKLNRIDEVPFDVIEEVLKRSIKDEFWRGKIISLAGLRVISKNKQTKFMNAYASLMDDYRPSAPTKELLGYRYKCPACGTKVGKREFRPENQFDAYTCEVEGCTKTQLVNKEMVGSTLKFVEKIYKEESQ